MDFDEEEDISVGLIRLKKNIPYHELFFEINQQNTFSFSRKADLRIEDFLGIYYFPIFGAFDELTQAHFTIIANQSCDSERKEKPIEGLFDLIVEEKYFINRNIDFILFSKENGEDFTTLNLPKKSVFPMEIYTLNLGEELYQIILDYDE